MQKTVSQFSYCHLKEGEEAEEECATLQAPGWSALGQCKASGDSVALSGTFMVEEPIAASFAMGVEQCLPKTCHALLGKAIGAARALAEQQMPGGGRRPPQWASFLADAPAQKLNLATLQALENFNPTMLLAMNTTQAPDAPEASSCQQQMQAAAAPFLQNCEWMTSQQEYGREHAFDMCMLNSGLPDKLCALECPGPEGGLLKCACSIYGEKKAAIAKASTTQAWAMNEMMQLQMNIVSQADACILSGNERACMAAQHGANVKLQKCSASGDVCTAALQLAVDLPGPYSSFSTSTRLSMCLPKVCHAPIQTVMAVALDEARRLSQSPYRRLPRAADAFMRLMATADTLPVHCGVSPTEIAIGKRPVQVPSSGALKVKFSSVAAILAAITDAASSAVALGSGAVMVAGAAVVVWRRKAAAEDTREPLLSGC